jgi:hypothetical protein
MRTSNGSKTGYGQKKMTKKTTYTIAVAASIFGNLLILLSQQITLRKKLPYSREYLFSGTLLQNYYNFVSIGAIAACAGVISYLTGVRPFHIAVFMVIIFPIITIYEGIAFPSSHNLLPFEIIMYIIMGIPTFVGALVGYRLKNKGNDNSALTTGSTADRDKSWWGF